MSTPSTITPPTSNPSTPFENFYAVIAKKHAQTSPFDVPLVTNEIKLAPFSKLKINQLPTTRDFEGKFKITQVIKSNNNTTTVLIKNMSNTGYSIGKIYNCHDTNGQKIKKKMSKYYNQYQIVKYSGLMEYFRFYYDVDTSSVTIHQQAYQQTLRAFITEKGPLQNEAQAKIIARDILSKLMRLHEYGYVHGNIKPNNIMERRLQHLYSTKFISDGWLLIDFDSMVEDKRKDIYYGSMGWSAPEISYTSKKNVYRSSADIFSFGLLILYIMFGYNPLEIPAKQIRKFKINKDDNKEQVWEKCKLKDEFYERWYNKCVLKSENVIKNYLVKLYYENKISLSLFQLLHDGMLVYDYKKRVSCKQIYGGEWLSEENNDFTD